MTDLRDADDLKEKYYHSMAAALIGEGDPEEAVVYLQKAIDIRDTPYVWHSLAGVLRETGDMAGAVGAMSRAIKLAPCTPEYYHEQGLILRQLGRPDLAGEQECKAVALDRNYERIDMITRAADIVERAFHGKDVPEDIVKTAVRNEELALILEKIGSGGQSIGNVLKKPSCPVGSCPAYCCHFTGKLLRHGVTIGPWKLDALRRHFTEKGIEEKDVLETFPVEQAEYAESLFPPQDIIKRNGVRSVVFPRQKDPPLGSEPARDLPRGRDYRTLMWIDTNAKPCAFLESGKCSIYDVGGEPSLDSCSSFLCMTGFVFVVLGHLGFTEEAMMTGKTMRELNGIAIDALIILAQGVYGNEEIAASEQAVLDGLRSAIEEDRSGNTALLEKEIARYRFLEEGHQGLRSMHLEKARQRIIKLFSPDQG